MWLCSKDWMCMYIYRYTLDIHSLNIYIYNYIIIYIHMHLCMLWTLLEPLNVYVSLFSWSRGSQVHLAPIVCAVPVNFLLGSCKDFCPQINIIHHGTAPKVPQSPTKSHKSRILNQECWWKQPTESTSCSWKTTHLTSGSLIRVFLRQRKAAVSKEKIGDDSNPSSCHGIESQESPR